MTRWTVQSYKDNTEFAGEVTATTTTAARKAMIAAANALATDLGIAELRLLIEQQRRARAQAAAFLDCDMAFHRRIAALTGNPIFPAVIEGMFGWLRAHYRSLVHAPGAESLTLADALPQFPRAQIVDGACHSLREFRQRDIVLGTVIDT